MRGLRSASTGVAVAVYVAAALAALMMPGCTGHEDGLGAPADPGEATPSPTEAVSTVPSRVNAQEEPHSRACCEEYGHAENPDAPDDEEEIVLVDPLMGAGMDPALAEVMPDFARVLGKDDILPIYDPVMVSAEESGLEDDDHVMGLAIDGEARAYPVRELFSREMVNDEVAGVPVLVTW